ncbi:MAG: hypothetical protein LBU78_00485 [Microbacterium sp.]|nr:hypothetical protein [Microbacterium sp.]
MARRPAPLSPSQKTTSPQTASPRSKTDAAKSAASGPATRERRGTRARRVDVGEWTSGIRLSAFSAIMLSLVVLGAWVLVPSLGT